MSNEDDSFSKIYIYGLLGGGILALALTTFAAIDPPQKEDDIAALAAPQPQMPVNRTQENLNAKNSAKVDSSIQNKNSNVDRSIQQKSTSVNREASQRVDQSIQKKNDDIDSNIQSKSNSVNREASKRVDSSISSKNAPVRNP